MSRWQPAAPADLRPPWDDLFCRLARDVAHGEQPAEVDELMLADVVRTMARLEQLRAVLVEAGPTVTGSKGQVRPHPLLTIEAQLVREVGAGLDRLQLSPSRRRRPVDVRGGRLRNP